MVLFQIYYILRFVWEEFLIASDNISVWVKLYANEVMIAIEGASFLVILLFHRRNLNCSSKEIMYDEVSSQESLSDGMHAEKPYYNSDSNEED